MFSDEEKRLVEMVRQGVQGDFWAWYKLQVYGLDGIDNCDRLSPGLSPFDAAEFLTLTHTEEVLEAGTVKENRFFQHYLPKVASLSMQKATLDVALKGLPEKAGLGTGEYGRIRGAWPHYELEFQNPATGIGLNLRYQGEHIVWWADLPHLFTYFAAFGAFAGEINFSSKTGREETFTLQGKGSFEHGFARKPFNFDPLWRPVRLLQAIFPSLRPVRYH